MHNNQIHVVVGERSFPCCCYKGNCLTFSAKNGKFDLTCFQQELNYRTEKVIHFVTRLVVMILVIVTMVQGQESYHGSRTKKLPRFKDKKGWRGLRRVWIPCQW